MGNKKAHVFQHCYSGLQMFVYDKPNKEAAKSELSFLGLNTIDWQYLGEKTAEDAI